MRTWLIPTTTRRTRTAETTGVEDGAVEMATRDIFNRQQGIRMGRQGQSVQLILFCCTISQTYQHFFDKPGMKVRVQWFPVVAEFSAVKPVPDSMRFSAHLTAQFIIYPKYCRVHACSGNMLAAIGGRMNGRMN